MKSAPTTQERRLLALAKATPLLRARDVAEHGVPTVVLSRLVSGGKLVWVAVFNAAKTVTDCFKFRNKIGLDVALEALRDGWRQRKFTMDQLWKYAAVNRVANVMRPYLEGLTG